MSNRFRISSPACSKAGRRRLLAALGFAALVVGVLNAPPLATFISFARAEQADRIVAVGGAVTEILYALGQQNRIAAVDATSLFPPEALREKPNVGYFRALPAEGVLAIRPSVVIAIDGAGPPDTIKILTEAGIRLEWAPDVPTREGVIIKIGAVGRAVGVAGAASRLAAEVDTRFDELAKMRAGIEKPRRVLFVLALQNGRHLVGGRGTAADAIIGLAGGINAAGTIEGYKPMTDEAVIAAATRRDRDDGSRWPCRRLGYLRYAGVLRNSGREDARADREGRALSHRLRAARARRRARSDGDALSRNEFSAFVRETSRYRSPRRSRRTMTIAATPITSSLALLVDNHRRRAALATALLLGLCAFLFVLALGNGAIAIAPTRVVEVLMRAALDPAFVAQDRDALIIVNIRLPRTLLGLEVGAALAVCGALMQGLFRNPLADPGLVGVSSGAGLAAAATIVLGDQLLAGLVGKLPFAVLPFGAFLGGLLATLAIYAIATRDGHTSMATMLLGGIALGAFAGALTSLLAYRSNDQQLRDLTFWSLGSLNGATWSKAVAITPIILPLVLVAPLLGGGLNGLAFGEAEAFHLGFRVQLLKTATIALVALGVGASVASSGVIEFIGIVARILSGWRSDLIIACSCRSPRSSALPCLSAPTRSRAPSLRRRTSREHSHRDDRRAVLLVAVAAAWPGISS